MLRTSSKLHARVTVAAMAKAISGKNKAKPVAKKKASKKPAAKPERTVDQTHTALKAAPAEQTSSLAPAAADKRAGGKWFTGYTNRVQLIDEPTTLASFDETSRGGDAEYLIFARGLTVTSALDLSRIERSIIVVLGALKAKRIILGDAVLVVEKSIEASELIYGPMSEGIFQLAGMQIETDPEDLATAISSPIVALYDRNQREWLLRQRNLPAFFAADLMDGSEVDASAMKKRLLAGKSIFSAR
jgi:hypothetical protein